MSDSLWRGTARSGTSRLLRWGVPLVMVVGGSLLIALSDSAFATGVGVSLAAGSVVVVFAGWFARLGDDSERIRERQARDQYLETGRWPDETGDAAGTGDPTAAGDAAGSPDQSG